MGIQNKTISTLGERAIVTLIGNKERIAKNKKEAVKKLFEEEKEYFAYSREIVVFYASNKTEKAELLDHFNIQQ